MAYGLRPYLSAIMGADENIDPYDRGPYGGQGYHGYQPRFPLGDDDICERFFGRDPCTNTVRFRGYDEGVDFNSREGLRYNTWGSDYPAHERILYTISEDMPWPEPDIRDGEEFYDCPEQFDSHYAGGRFDPGYGPYEGVEIGEIDDWDGFDRGEGPYAGVGLGRLDDHEHRDFDSSYGPYPGVPMGHLDNNGPGGWGEWRGVQMGYMPEGPWRTQQGAATCSWRARPIAVPGLGSFYD